MNGKEEEQYILKILRDTPKDKMMKVIWSAMHILKINPDMSVQEAMEYGYNDWVKEEKK